MNACLSAVHRVKWSCFYKGITVEAFQQNTETNCPTAPKDTVLEALIFDEDQTQWEAPFLHLTSC